MPHVLVTGGAGFIGSHTVVELVNAGYKVTAVDNYSNARPGVWDRVNKITGKPDAVTVHNVDLRDAAALKKVFTAAPVDGVIHFAAFKAVGESKQKPLMYYDNNLVGMITLLKVMEECNCKTLVFSSSCTVYGVQEPPLDETKGRGAVTNAYAGTKLMAEMMLEELCACDPTWAVCILRYFNPVAAHPSGLIGEDPQGIPNCLMPYVLQVLVGRLPKLTVYGNDYETRDGTCIRDYIHVVDVAVGHIDALKWMAKESASRTAAGKAAGFIDIFNLGTGNGVSVLELVHGMEKASGKPVPYTLGPRRPGDLAQAYANPAKAESVLGWKAQYGVDKMCEDAWRWQSNNPNGYA